MKSEKFASAPQFFTFFCNFVPVKRELSILIPVYNGHCLSLVTELSRQAEAVEGLIYEIIVADDGSPDAACVEANRPIEHLPHCRYVVRSENIGRSAIRNFLAREAQYCWLLYLDGDMSIVRPDFLQNYLNDDSSNVAYGGYTVGHAETSCLRYLYEKGAEASHTVEQRRLQPYRDFHTANFMVSREVMTAHPFDERFRHYGYEDVFWGKQLRQAGIAITHIDSPAHFAIFEDNAHFVAKTEDGLRTLHQFRDDLRGYNNLLTFVNGIHLSPVKWGIRLWHLLFGSLERRLLCGSHPSLTLFKLYKLGYYLSLEFRIKS